jgi:hypothetical protein
MESIMAQTPRPAQIDDLHRAKRGVAVLASCIVQTINESDPSFERRFLERLSAAYSLVKDNEDGHWNGDVIQELELLAWTREYLTGFSHIRGQEPEFLKDYKPK